METMESLSSILDHRGKTFSLKELLTGHKKSLTAIEKKIIHKRINSGLSFCQLSEKEKLLAADKIVSQCVSIYGCPLPQSELIQEGLTESLSVFINEFGYENLTVDEIILALRFNASGELRVPPGIEVEKVSFSGHYVNVSFIANTLHNYLVVRKLIDRKFQNQIDGYE